MPTRGWPRDGRGGNAAFLSGNTSFWQIRLEDPVEVIKRNIYVSPFHEDDIGELIDLLGVDHILFGSDYPHPEGLAEPCSYVDHLPPDLPQEDVARIMGGNLAQLMGVEVAAAR